MEILKGFKTIILMMLVMGNAALTAGGFWTPEVSAQVDSSVRAVITHMEDVFAAIQALIGVAGIAARAVTTTPIFNK